MHVVIEKAVTTVPSRRNPKIFFEFCQVNSRFINSFSRWRDV